MSGAPASSASPSASSHALDLAAPALVTAAETFQRTHSGETVDGVIARRALGHYAESIRQYLTIRAGDAGARALAGVTEDARDGGWLLAPPGPRARLFREARARIEPLGCPPSDDALAWFAPRDADRASRLAALRAMFDARERELLELCHTRALSIEEIAFVVAAPVDEVCAALEGARGRAEAALRRLGVPRRDAGDHLREAFALRRARSARPAAPRYPAGEVIGERYEIESHLGSGGFADVYRARDREVPDHVVALKIRRQPSDHEASRAAARRELRLIASVFHPSVVQLKDHGWHDGRLWFVMPYYQGETLAARLARGRLSRVEALAIFEPLAHALAAMHRSGVRHQDIKPENIFLARLDPAAGEATVLPVLLDLGVAVRDAEAVLAGTPGYFAPEVAALFAGIPDPPALSDRSDVFSLALALRNALEPQGTEDIVGGSVDAFVARRACRAPSPPSSELAFLRPSFERWLALSPDERPTAEELGRELRVLTKPEEQRARRSAVLRWVAPLVVAFTALSVAGFWIASRETELQRLEAERARQQAEAQRVIAQSAQARAANFRQDLTVESRMRRALEQEVERLRQEYQSSRLTREDLVTRLAQAEGELGVREQRYLEAARQAERELTLAHEERVALVAQLEERASELSQARQRHAALAQVEEELRQDIVDAESARDAAARERDALRRELDVVGPARVPPSPFHDVTRDDAMEGTTRESEDTPTAVDERGADAAAPRPS